MTEGMACTTGFSLKNQPWQMRSDTHSQHGKPLGVAGGGKSHQFLQLEAYACPWGTRLCPNITHPSGFGSHLPQTQPLGAAADPISVLGEGAPPFASRFSLPGSHITDP